MAKEQEYQAMLDEELKEYLKETKTAYKECKSLREWVTTGHSVHENNAMAMCECEYTIDFFDIYREEEKLRQATRDITPENTIKYMMNYYGYSEEPRNHELEPMNKDISGKVLTGYNFLLLWVCASIYKY